MTSWTNHQVEIYEYGSGLFPGPLVGTLTNLLAGGAEGTNNLDEVGHGWFKIHGADTPSLSLCQDFRLARVTAVSSVTGRSHEICCFIIRNRIPEIVGRQVIYTISGPDLTGNIPWGNIAFEVISDNAGGPSPTPIDDCLLLTDKAWTVTAHGTAPNDAVFVGSGETAYVVLLSLLQQQNAHFSFGLSNNPAFELHVWYEHTASSGIGFDALTLLESDNPAAYQADSSVAIITKPIRIIKENRQVYTRAWIYGAGMGADRWTFAQFSLGPLVIPGWGYDPFSSLIINTALEESMPVIATTKGFPELEPIDPDNETAVRTNARAIFYAGLNWLRNQAKSEIVYYEIPNVIIHGDIIPGQLVHVTYNRNSPVDSSGAMNETEILSLDDDLIVLAIRHRLGQDGIRYTDLIVGDTPKPLDGSTNILANKLKDLEQTVRHTNAGSGSPGAPTGESSYLWSTGSGPILTGDLLVDPLVTVDGVDISAHAADPNAHHSPGTLSASSINFNNGIETHAVDASSNPGVQTYLLKTDAGGRVILARIDLDNLILTDRITSEQYNIFLSNGKMFIEPI